MTIELDECPCTGKNMSNLAAPWSLLTLYHRLGIHGYKLHRPPPLRTRHGRVAPDSGEPFEPKMGANRQQDLITDHEDAGDCAGKNKFRVWPAGVIH
ncbi:MAG: hypothetical protein R6V60_07520 [Desulfobacterales bacterium]